MINLRGSSVIVTGAASGLGAATAQALAARGALVYGFDLAPFTESALEHAVAIHVDVTDAVAVQQAVEQVAQGGRPLRVVVNCAGIAPSMRIVGRRGTHDLSLFARVIAINLTGTFNVLASAAGHMAAQDPSEEGQRGVIVNTSSIAAFEGQVGQAAYAASKGGVAALTLQAARDLADTGIRVCSVAPGIFDSPMLATISDEYRHSLAESVPFPKRLGLPDEYAKLVLTIIDQPYLNGEVIRLDGALRMAPR